MIEKKGKVETRKEFDENAIKWGYRVGITDVATAKSLYWCVLNIYSLQNEFIRMGKSLDESLKRITKLESLNLTLVKKINKLRRRIDDKKGK